MCLDRFHCAALSSRVAIRVTVVNRRLRSEPDNPYLGRITGDPELTELLLDGREAPTARSQEFSRLVEAFGRF